MGKPLHSPCNGQCEGAWTIYTSQASSTFHTGQSDTPGWLHMTRRGLLHPRVIARCWYPPNAQLTLENPHANPTSFVPTSHHRDRAHHPHSRTHPAYRHACALYRNRPRAGAPLSCCSELFQPDGPVCRRYVSGLRQAARSTTASVLATDLLASPLPEHVEDGELPPTYDQAVGADHPTGQDALMLDPSLSGRARAQALKHVQRLDDLLDKAEQLGMLLLGRNEQGETSIDVNTVASLCKKIDRLRSS